MYRSTASCTTPGAGLTPPLFRLIIDGDTRYASRTSRQKASSSAQRSAGTSPIGGSLSARPPSFEKSSPGHKAIPPIAAAVRFKKVLRSIPLAITALSFFVRNPPSLLHIHRFYRRQPGHRQGLQPGAPFRPGAPDK